MRFIVGLCFILSLYGGTSYAQESLKPQKFEYQVFTKGVNQIDKAELFILKEGAYYIAQYDDSASEEIGGSTTSAIDPTTKMRIYYDPKSDSIFTFGIMKSVHPEGVIICEKRERIQWNLRDSTQIINGHQCKLATGRFRGRNYIAWYDPQLKTKAIGPWKLHGLPGLIVYAYDEENYISFKLVKHQLILNDEAPNLSIDTNLAMVSRAEHRAYQEKVFKRMKNADAPEGVTIKIDVKVEQLERN